MKIVFLDRYNSNGAKLRDHIITFTEATRPSPVVAVTT